MLKSRSTTRRQLLIQCGGHGNLKRTILVMRRVMELNEFKEYFTNMNQSWYFAKPDDTRKLLRKIGYVNSKVYLHNDHVIMTNRKVYSRFVKTVIMKQFLECLPDDDKLRNRYLNSFLYEVERKSANRSQNPWVLDYVRLNIIADKL
jgi:ABC-type phosphate/phosphonate transport system ATPase subunit